MINLPQNYWPIHKDMWWAEHGKLTYNQRVAVLSNPHSILGKKLAQRVHGMVMDILAPNKKEN
ncbi:hypothetical protein CMI37_39210 [Candidatus Pacearchaeota archaeon]|nr:hypothetical protein [Candidatus Pacearchaeota archaeon]